MYIVLKPMRKVLLITLIWLVIVNVYALIVLNRFNLSSDTAYNWINPTEFHQVKSWNPQELLVHWDSVWYLRVASEGYSFNGFNNPSNIVFFPLYPFLIYVTSFLTLGNYILAGWIVSVVSLFLAVFYLYKLVSEFQKEINPALVVIFMLVFPTSFFLNSIYTESTFIFLSVAAFYYTLKRNFLLAGIFGILASLTRVTGFLLLVPLLIEYLQIFNWKGLFKFQILPILAIPLGTFCYFLSHYFLYGDLFLFIKAQAWFGRSFEINQDHLMLFSNPSIVHFALDLSFVILAAVLIILIAKRLRFSYAVYVFLLIAIPLSTGTLMSIGRYILIAFPIFLLLASVKNEVVRFGFLLISTLLLSMYITLFVNNYWAG